MLQKLGKRTRLIREVVRDVAGLAPYERRVSELLKVGKDKRALKLCKKKVSNQYREFVYVVPKWMCVHSLLRWCSWVHIFVQRKRGKRWATYCVRPRNRVYTPCNNIWRHTRLDHSYSNLLCIPLSQQNAYREVSVTVRMNF